MEKEFVFFDQMSVLNVRGSTHEFPMHNHDTFCISTINKGVFGENQQIASVGTILISHPNELHVNALVNNNAYDMTTLYISEDVLRYSSGLETIHFQNKVIDSPDLFHFFRQLALDSFDKINHSLVYSNPEKRIQEGLNELVHKYGGLGSFKPQMFDTKLVEVKNYILRNISEKITLLDLAKMVDMDKFKFIRWFRKKAGLTPFEFVLLTRIEQAKKMIKNGKPIVDVALDSGFYDQSNFSNYFNRYVGVSPKKYSTSCNILQEFEKY